VTSGHSQIRRFSLSSSSIPNSGYDWKDGQLLAWGMRNAVGIALSQDNSRLWEVENSADDVTWMGDDVHQVSVFGTVVRTPLTS
jgi:glucose/arabinose dehydrogenase